MYVHICAMYNILLVKQSDSKKLKLACYTFISENFCEIYFNLHVVTVYSYICIYFY